MSARLSEQRLAEIMARASAATDGPWCTDSWEIYQGTEYVPGISFWIGETCRGTADLAQDEADAAFVAAARTDVPELVAEVQFLRAQVAGLESSVHELTSHEQEALWFALELAADQMANRGDEFDAADDAALESLRRLAGEDVPTPAPDFYQPGYTYSDTDPEWRFRCDTVTTHPEDGERTALGWRFFRGEWDAIAYGEDDWDLCKFDGRAATGVPRG